MSTHSLMLSVRSVSTSTQKTSATAEARSKEGRFYKPLPEEFRRGEFQYRQIAREADAAVYKQIWLGCAEPSPCYEVIRVRRREGFQIGGRFVEPAEVYPNSEAWGQTASPSPINTRHSQSCERSLDLKRSRSFRAKKEPQAPRKIAHMTNGAKNRHRQLKIAHKTTQKSP